MASFGEVLESFKQNEEPENIVPLLEDAELRNALVAWKSVAVDFNTPEDCPHKEPVRQWNWLWSQIRYDAATFATVAGAKAADVKSLMRRLIGLRLIYPDGTINKLAAQYMQSLIMAKLPKRRGRPPSENSEK